MKLNKKLIITFAVLEFIFIIGVYMLGSMKGSKSLGIMDLIFLAFISLISAFFVNILFIGIGRIIKSIINK